MRNSDRNKLNILFLIFSISLIILGYFVNVSNLTFIFSDDGIIDYSNVIIIWILVKFIFHIHVNYYFKNYKVCQLFQDLRLKISLYLKF